nr:ribonuclease H-like domain, reverse transcriptase, RNA-dependent DNA polymerase [Tanacetum cinerariifolium]
VKEYQEKDKIGSKPDKNGKPSVPAGSRNSSASTSAVHPHVNKDIGIIDSGFSRSKRGNKDKLDDFVQVKGGKVTFGGGD